MRCPYCDSEDTSPSEQEFSRDYPFWIVLVSVFALILVLGLFFLFLQLHPVIIILILIAVVSRLLDQKRTKKRKKAHVEYICLNCEKKFKNTSHTSNQKNSL